LSQTHLIPSGARQLRADKALAAAFPEHSRAAFQRAFASGLVRRGGRPLSQDEKVRAGEAIEFSLPELRPSELRASPIPLAVLWEDEHFLALDKPPGMVVHPGAGTGEDTLVHALLAHCEGKLSGIGGVARPGIVHRLDRGTSGVILAAKTDAAHRGLAAQFAKRTVIKEYLALTAGSPPTAGGTIRRAIGRDPRRRHRMAVVTAAGGGRSARTDWMVVERFGREEALLKCILHTGRTHQIRVHLKSIGHPLLGDTVYGWNTKPGQPPVARVMLHAEHIALEHPITKQRLDFRAPLPADFCTLMEELRFSRIRPLSQGL
jgi:23S rRNA pseudouridine1911/1915/1917 synthase